MDGLDQPITGRDSRPLCHLTRHPYHISSCRQSVHKEISLIQRILKFILVWVLDIFIKATYVAKHQTEQKGL